MTNRCSYVSVGLGRAMLIVLLISLVMLVLMIASGCSAEFPIKWKPTEPQKQAADLAVTNIAALRPHVPAEVQPIAAEAEKAARITQTYLGLPAERPTSVADANAAMLAAAGADAARAAPTIGQIGAAVTDELQRKSDAAFGLADSILALLATVASTYGATKLGQKVVGWKDKSGQLQEQVDTQFTALKQLVAGIDKLAPEVKAQVKAVMSQTQTGETPMLVAEAKNAT